MPLLKDVKELHTAHDIQCHYTHPGLTQFTCCVQSLRVESKRNGALFMVMSWVCVLDKRSIPSYL